MASQMEQPADTSVIDVGKIEAVGQKMVQDVNESMQILSNSKDLAERRSHVRLAHGKIEQLLEWAAEFPFIKIQQLHEVKRDLAKIERETDLMESLRRIGPKEFDASCDCGCDFGVPITDLDSKYACPECGQISQFTVEEVAAIRAVANDAEEKALVSLGGLFGLISKK